VSSLVGPGDGPRVGSPDAARESGLKLGARATRRETFVDGLDGAVAAHLQLRSGCLTYLACSSSPAGPLKRIRPPLDCIASSSGLMGSVTEAGQRVRTRIRMVRIMRTVRMILTLLPERRFVRDAHPRKMFFRCHESTRASGAKVGAAGAERPCRAPLSTSDGSRSRPWVSDNEPALVVNGDISTVKEAVQVCTEREPIRDGCSPPFA
jgi:hypothetical protein